MPGFGREMETSNVVACVFVLLFFWFVVLFSFLFSFEKRTKCDFVLVVGVVSIFCFSSAQIILGTWSHLGFIFFPLSQFLHFLPISVVSKGVELSRIEFWSDGEHVCICL